jgi:hypothetical protein
MHRVYVFWERIDDFAGAGFTKNILTSADALAWAIPAV